jgi:nitroreductase
VIDAILRRRSIRKYKQDPIPRSLIEEVLKAGILAPSSKNRQPWKFIVVTGEARKEAVRTMKTGIDRERKTPYLPASAPYIRDALFTVRIMEQAPVLIFVMNELGYSLNKTLTRDEHVSEICNAESIGAAIENMTLAATDLGLGSLWVANTYFAYPELCTYLHSKGELVAALALGYPAEAPARRPRKSLEEAVEWRE